jgi:hypothetical protein
MQVDPIAEWQRLTEHYRKMSDEELGELAFDHDNLTDTAQQALRAEMSNRGLGRPQAASNAPKFSGSSWPAQPESGFDRQSTQSASEDGTDADAEDAAGRESIRRLPLCECGDWKQAWQICAMLKAGAIESWIQDSREDPEGSLLYSPDMGPPSALFTSRTFRVLVAADRLLEAREIAAQPVPREIAKASEMNVPEFTAPRCPACGAEDPVLESVNPANMWRCEQCDREWADALPDPTSEAPN